MQDELLALHLLREALQDALRDELQLRIAGVLSSLNFPRRSAGSASITACIAGKALQ
jgi:hypothetical protein